MRNLINIIESSQRTILERIDHYPVRGREVPVLENPTRSELRGFLNRYGELRACALWNGDLLVFPSSMAIHGDIYGESDQYPVMINNDGDVEYRIDSGFDPDAISEFRDELLERLPNHKGLSRALGEFQIHVEIPNDNGDQ